MQTQVAQTDKGLGLSLALSLLAGGAAAGMLVLPGQVNRAIAFAAAVIAASLAVVATQAFE